MRIGALCNIQKAAAVAANDRAYEAAFAKAGVKALADFFTEDVSYTADDGRTYQGRAAIEELLSASFSANPGATLAIHSESVRPLTPEVLVENGSTTTVSRNGDESTTIFTAVHVKKDGKWKIGQLMETPAPVATPGEHLSELGWLAGEWKEADEEAGVTIHSR